MLPMLREQQELIRRQLQSCCIAMVDIDSFKQINDQYGHVVGDKILTAVAQYFMKNLRPYEKIFRFGGEEFLLCMQQVNANQAFHLLDHIREKIATVPFNIGLQDPLHITVSCGIAVLDPSTTIEESIDQTDKALYLAKTSGKSQTKIWSP